MVEILETYLGRDWNIVTLIIIFVLLSFVLAVLDFLHGYSGQ